MEMWAVKVKVRFLNLLVEISFFPSCALLVYRVSYYKAILYTNVDRREDRSFLNFYLFFFRVAYWYSGCFTIM